MTKMFEFGRKIVVCLVVWLTIYIGLTRAECNLIDEGTTREEIYNDCNNYYRRCERTRFVRIGPITYSCSNTTLDQVNESIKNQDLPIHLSITKSSIPLMTLNSYRFDKITDLRIIEAGVTKIIPGFFNDLKNLKNLLLTNNSVSDIADGMFASLHSLENLTLSHNRIKSISEHALMGVENLKSLNLSYNEISAVNPALFSYGLKLETIDVSHNNLTDFAVKLPGTISLIDLSFNQIQNASALIQSPVRDLVLNNNNISRIDRIGHVSRLSISHNKIAALGAKFAGPSLTYIDLSYNNISSIAADSFVDAQNLGQLNLQHNSIKWLSIGSFNTLHLLTLLDLSYNDISSIQFGLFSGLQQLKYLDLSDNKFSLNFHTLTSLTSLEDLRFSGTAAATANFDFTFLLSHFKKLKTISMDRIAWRCSELAKTIHQLHSRGVIIAKGSTDLSSNVLGIACSDSVETVNPKERYNSPDDNADKNLSGSLFYKYFDSEFRNTNFYKFMEGLVQKLPNRTELRDTPTPWVLTEDFRKFLETEKLPNRTELNVTNSSISTEDFRKYIEATSNVFQRAMDGFNRTIEKIANESIFVIKNDKTSQENDLTKWNETVFRMLTFAKNRSDYPLNLSRAESAPLVSKDLQEIVELLEDEKKKTSGHSTTLTIGVVLLFLMFCLLTYSVFLFRKVYLTKKKEEIPLM